MMSEIGLKLGKEISVVFKEENQNINSRGE